MSRPTRLEVVMLLEKRIEEFVESVTGESVKPKLSLLPEMAERDVLLKVIQTRIAKAFFLREHLKDDHVRNGCSLCGQIVDSYRYQGESKAYQFIEINKELLAELSLTR